MTYVEPLVAGFLLLAAAGLWLRRRALVWCALAGLLLACSEPAAWLASQPFEAWYPSSPYPPSDAQAIVVLSSGTLPRSQDRPYPVPDHYTYERSLHAAWLYKNWRPLPILACGGMYRMDALADVIKRLLEAEGVPPERIWTEERSSSTWENAVFGAEILKRNGISRIALVTSAAHMPRSERSFRKQGLVVVPAPCCFAYFPFRPGSLVPNKQGLTRNEFVLHEAVGLFVYWMRGRL